jgi:hypothetical protein
LSCSIRSAICSRIAVSRPCRRNDAAPAALDTVLRQAFQTDQAILDQRRHAVGQQPIQHRLMIGAEVRQSMIVHPYAAAQPAINEVALAQAHDLAGAADTIDHRIEPQRQQQTRVDRPHRVRARLDRGVKLTQLQRRHKAPHQTSRMIGRDQGVEINHLVRHAGAAAPAALPN